MNFSQALEAAKDGHKIARESFRDTCFIVAKYPTPDSQNTLPYLQMYKKIKYQNGEEGKNIFPVDLSCESIFAEDWKVIE